MAANLQKVIRHESYFSVVSQSDGYRDCVVLKCCQPWQLHQTYSASQREDGTSRKVNKSLAGDVLQTNNNMGRNDVITNFNSKRKRGRQNKVFLCTRGLFLFRSFSYDAFWRPGSIVQTKEQTKDGHSKVSLRERKKTHS